MHLLKCLVLVGAAALAAPAHAQLRTIPADAKRATLRHVQDMIVELDGKLVRLSPGAQIRDSFNRLVLPTALASKTSVKYATDANRAQRQRQAIDLLVQARDAAREAGVEQLVQQAETRLADLGAAG